ncbi:MAG: alanine--tRNA ligase-related protein [Candidatus Beckwithbacteria bacterium]|nr:alanine--tRNA ligase-related protein [Candidatus Beckwithbacteria bacterium]
MTFPELKDLSPKIDIQQEQKFVTDQFLQFYEENGYQSLPSADLLPQDDQSVLFTGATITPLKKFLEEGVATPGLVMVQKCLRTKRLEEMTNLSKISDWTHYFTMCGILAAPGRAETVANEAFELLINRLKINPENLLVEAASADRDLSTFWSNKGTRVIEDSQPKNYYHWHYGIPGISGRGINLQLRFGQNSTYRDLGNLISVEDANSRVIAYEFGFGLESLIATKHGFKKPMEASLVSSVIPYKEGLQEKFIDTLMAAAVIFHYGVEPGRGKEKHVLKKLIKGLSFLRRKMSIDNDQIKDWCEKFETVEFGNSDSGDKLINGIIVYEQQLAKFFDYAKNQVHAHQLRNDLGEKLLEKLNRQGGDMGILPVEIEEVIIKNYPKVD